MPSVLIDGPEKRNRKHRDSAGRDPSCKRPYQQRLTMEIGVAQRLRVIWIDLCFFFQVPFGSEVQRGGWE